MRFGINQKLVGSFLVGTSIVAVFIVWTFTTITDLIDTLDESAAISRRVEKTAELQLELYRMVNVFDDYLITGDVKKRDDLDTILTRLADILREFEASEGDERWNETLSRVHDGSETLAAMSVELLFAEDPVGNPAVARMMEEATLYANALIVVAARFRHIAEEEREAVESSALSSAMRTKSVLYSLPVFGVILFFVLFFHMRYYITRPIMELYRGAERISDGDFSHPVRVSTRDELGELAGRFNTMAEAIKEREEKTISLLKLVDKVNEELLQSSHYKAAFISNISHELKTPLTHVIGFSELLKMDKEGILTETAKKYTDNIHKSGKELLTLINSMLDVTRTAGSTEIKKAEFDVAEVVGAAAAASVAEAKGKGVQLKIRYGSGVGTILADKALFSEIIANLLSNAVKFTPPAGTVILSLDTSIDGKAKYLEIKVTDTGKGISKEDLKDIFNPFVVGEKTSVRTFGGLGVGLALTKRFVEVLDGRIDVESEEGKGSTFTVSLPAGRVGDAAGEVAGA